MNKRKVLNHIRTQRVRRVRAKISGTAGRPRLSVFRSNKGMYAQLIDDMAGKTLVAAWSKELGAAAKKKKTEQAFSIGEALAKKAATKGIKQAVLDRRGYQYHGRVKAIADGARKGGLTL